MRAGMPFCFMLSENSQAPITAKAGLTNSEGWMVCPAAEIQRRAPLTSTPSLSVSQSSTMLTISTPSAAKRALR